MNGELFNLNAVDSLIRQVISKDETVNLRDFNFPIYEYPKNANIAEHHITDQKTSGKQIRKILEPIFQEAEQKGYNSNLFTSGYEAILNAYQHGNKKDPSKKIKTGHLITNNEFIFTVEDEGGVLKSDFLPYILEHRLRTDLEKRFVNFYKFTNTEAPNTNLGTGTSFIHVYPDFVNYYKGSNSGLVVEIHKKNKNILH